MRKLKLFFATDIHGSTFVFKKFLNALKIYDVDVGILMGDLSGKMIVPILKLPNETYKCSFLGQEITAKTNDELKKMEETIAITGNYYVHLTPEEFEELKAEGKTIKGRIDEVALGISLGGEKIEKLFIRLITERLNEWMKLAEERLRGTKIKLYMAPGNDDILQVNEVLDNSKSVVNLDGRKLFINDHEIITLSWSNPTPWKTPRETTEEELAKMIDSLASQIESMESAIFNFHVPPYGTHLDQAPKLTKDLKPSISETISVGSKAVLEAIKRYQPLLGLHGHIHESRGLERIGRTLCINPGSEYTEGILRGAIITLEKNKVSSFLFTSG